MSGRFNTVEELREYVENYLRNHNMTEAELRAEAKKHLILLDYNLEDCLEHVQGLENDVSRLNDELETLRSLVDRNRKRG